MNFSPIHPRPFFRRGGFTLTEMLVAVALLSLIMLLVGQVFSITVKSTGQATALTDVNQRLRGFEQALRTDLENVSSENSLLIIQAREVNAYWTQGGLEADTVSQGEQRKNPLDGYPHVRDPEREDENGRLQPPRGDVLSFFTLHEGRSFVFPGLTAQAQHVTYGHANRCDYTPNPDKQSLTGFRSNWDPDVDQFPDVQEASDVPANDRVPASRWHLSRRAILLTAIPKPDENDWPFSQEMEENLINEVPADANKDGDYTILNGLVDVVCEFDYHRQVLAPMVMPPYEDGEYRDSGNNPVPGWRSRYWVARSVLDPQLPAPLADRVGNYFLPSCASFKVEWTLDDPRLTNSDHVVWFDALIVKREDDEDRMDPLAVLEREIEAMKERVDNDPDHPFVKGLEDLRDEVEADLRFAMDDPEVEDVPALFWAPRIYDKVDFNQRRVIEPAVPDPFFPAALRITVDVYDELERLERPIRHVMVIPIGS